MLTGWLVLAFSVGIAFGSGSSQGARGLFTQPRPKGEPIVTAAGGRRPYTPEAFIGEARNAGPDHAGLNPYAVRLEYRFAVREATQLSRFLRLNEWYSFRRRLLWLMQI